MEIERINENTVKFYISYGDIEDRGFQREEIWYNRERSEQLFWQMMDELNYKEDFHVEGPLWIQVQALEKGLEIIVTKAQLSKNGDNLELPIEDGNTIDIPVDEKVENLLEEKFGKSIDDELEKDEEDDSNLWIIVSFRDFEDVIQLSHSFNEETESIEEALYSLNNKYYLFMEFSNEDPDEKQQEDTISRVLEFADDSDVTIHYLQEYGKQIFASNTFSQVREYFPQKA
ncbi:adapter protein MecA 1/2 [Oceanobacillus limi]|uniref:Adapter protein MecA n=1 Tax=Oceanobacillus limi TaxID=930131 RepID=A0A1I0C9T2_9BACI|nr:adaptor protein MecA [Oceanobacillus limi]SET15625.1 adapter protein MecA 1/2 [Oceanobacillus limi]